MAGVPMTMVERIAAVAGCAALLAFLHPAPAASKGPIRGFVFDGYFLPRDRVAGVEILHIGPRFRDLAPYFAFLENRSDARINFGWPSPPLDEPLALGRLSLRFFTFQGERRVEARLTFEVPDVRRGLYDVIVCDAGCEHRVGRLSPSALYVVANGTERVLRNEVDALRSEVSRWEGRVVRLSGQLPKHLPKKWRILGSQMDSLQADVINLTQRIARPPHVHAGNGPAVSALAGGLLAAALVGAVVAAYPRPNGPLA